MNSTPDTQPSTLSCTGFENLLPDALGGEMDADQRVAFDNHLKACERCRQEYDSLRSTVQIMQNLSGARQVSVHREGDRLIIDGYRELQRRQPSWQGSSLLRYAAVILVAFTTGYAFHAEVMMKSSTIQAPATPGATQSQDVLPGQSLTLHSALAQSYTREPQGSSLAKCTKALFATPEK